MMQTEMRGSGTATNVRRTAPGPRSVALIPATLQAECRCPARSDYVELCFDTADGPWTWCFPEPQEPSESVPGVDAVAITVGPFGAQARYVVGQTLGFAMLTAEAMALIEAGTPTFIARKLVERGW